MIVFIWKNGEIDDKDNYGYYFVIITDDGIEGLIQNLMSN